MAVADYTCKGLAMEPRGDEGDPGVLLAVFGEAKVMKFRDGRVELVGETTADRKAALEWLARFVPELRRSLPKPRPAPRRK